MLQGFDHRRVSVTSVSHLALEGLHDRGPSDLVIVLMNHPSLRGYVGRGYELENGLAVVLWLLGDRFWLFQIPGVVGVFPAVLGARRVEVQVKL